jgi:hypothetical protein
VSNTTRKVIGLAAVGFGIFISVLSGGVATAVAARFLIVPGILLFTSAKRPKIVTSTSLGTNLQLSGDPESVRYIFYGEAWTAGDLRFRKATGVSNADLYLVIVLAGHEIDSVQQVIGDKQVLTLDGGGTVSAVDGVSTHGWVGRMTWRFYTGTDTQTADAALTTAFPVEWDSNHHLKGLAYAIGHLTFDETAMNTIPEFRFLVRGRKVYDPRLDSTNGGSGSQRVATPSTWAWSRNAVLCHNDFDRGIVVNGVVIAGLGIASTRFDWPNVIAEANVCDENVSLAAGGNQKRYTADGVIDPRQGPDGIRQTFQLAFAGEAPLADGKIRYYAGAYRTPTLSLVDDHFVGPIQHNVWPGEGDRVDTAQGSFASYAEFGSVVDYAPIALASATASSPRIASIDLQLVSDITNSAGVYDGGARAQRIAKLLLEKQAAGKQLKLTTSLYGLRCVPGETVQVTRSSLGLAAQTMRVGEMQLRFVQIDQGVVPLVDLGVQAGPSSIYTWAATETRIAAPPAIPLAPAVELPPGAWTMTQSGIARVGSTYFKVSGVDAVWDAGFSSVEGFEGCFVSWTFGATGVAIGLSGTVPAAISTGFWNTFPMWNAAFYNASFWVAGSAITNYAYQNLDFGIMAHPDGHAYIYEAGVGILDLGTFTPGTTRFKILFDGQKLEYFRDEAKLPRVVPLSGAALHLNSSFYSRQAYVKALAFGPVGLGLPIVDELGDNFSYRDASEFARNWIVLAGGSYPTDVSIVRGLADAPGGTALEIGNNSGDDGLTAALNTLAPYDGISTYEVSALVQQLAGAGGFWLGLEGLAADGKTIIDAAGGATHAAHWVAAGNASPGVGWTWYRGYALGWSTGPGGQHVDSSVPGTLFAGVAHVRPIFVANYNAVAGRTRIAAVRLRRLSAALQAKNQVNTPEIVDSAVNLTWQWTDVNGVGYSNIA